MDKSTIGDKMMSLRGSMSQRQASALVGIKPQNWNVYEKGQSIPGAEVVIKLCNTFGVSADWLLGLSDRRERSDGVGAGVGASVAVPVSETIIQKPAKTKHAAKPAAALDPLTLVLAELRRLSLRIDRLESTTASNCG